MAFKVGARPDSVCMAGVLRDDERPFRGKDTTVAELRLAHGERMTGRQLADRFSVSTATISRALRRYGMEPNGTFYAGLVPKEDYAEAHLDNLTYSEAGGRLGVSEQAVRMAWSALGLRPHKMIKDEESRERMVLCLNAGISVEEIAGSMGVGVWGLRTRARAYYEKELGKLELNLIPGQDYDIGEYARILTYVPHLIGECGLDQIEKRIRYYKMNFGITNRMLIQNREILGYPLDHSMSRLEYFSSIMELYSDRKMEASGKFVDQKGIFRKVNSKKLLDLLNSNDEEFIDIMKHSYYTTSAELQDYARFRRRLITVIRKEEL